MKANTVPLKKMNSMLISIRLSVPSSNIKYVHNQDTDTVELNITSQGFEVDLEPIDVMDRMLMEQGISREICAKVHDTAIDVLQQELGLEILKDFMPSYRD